jgi:aminopeptidase N
MKLLCKYLLFVIVGGTVACQTTVPISTPPPGPAVVTVPSDSVAQKEDFPYEPRLYRAEKTRHFKLLHTKLEVRFDWQERQLLGKANLILEPYFYDQSRLILDAKDFEIHQVTIFRGNDHIHPKYDYDGSKINVELGANYRRRQKLHIEIDYTAKPYQNPDSLGLSSDKKGLYFINHTGEIKGKPRQIWTHGETEDGSRWFPTIDAPNQKSTQEMFITVEDEFKTLSNGKLIYSKSNADGTRTDYWKMDKPHAPYLFMMAVGNFAIVEDNWNDMPVNYYVEPAFERYASDIFGRTPEMIEFFSDTLNYPFPWPKYSQVVVRDFVSGAMENTSASVFMPDLQVSARELIDYNWDDIIAHELFHQWFGDLVTCESWANLPLNESFATYGEYLWKTHKYGQDEGDLHLFDELQAYLEESTVKQVDLIRYSYQDEDDLFDSHSYAKGGLILHMLRNYLGDEAFFTSLAYYLHEHAFGKAEVHDLRLAFEHVSGEDLNWFFNQWFLEAGHPELIINEQYDQQDSVLTLQIRQSQDKERYPVFKLPFVVDIWENGQKGQFLIEVDRPYQEFEFRYITKPDLVLVDSDYILVGTSNHLKSTGQWLFQYRNYAGSFRARYEAFTELAAADSRDVLVELLPNALADPFHLIREEALTILAQDTTALFQTVDEMVIEMATSDPNTLVRAAAIDVLSQMGDGQFLSVFRGAIYDSSYAVAGSALYAYLQEDASDRLEIVLSLKSENSLSITASIADYFISVQDYGQYEWFEEKLLGYNGGDLWYFTRLFGMYLLVAQPEEMAKGIEKLREIATDHSQFYNRLSAYQSLELLADVEGVADILQQLQASEKDPRVREYFDE